MQWCNDGTAGPCPGQDRLSLIQYDSLGRVIHREDKVAGMTVAATINDYTYDVGVGNDTPPVTATHMLGRLATASWGDPSSLAGGKVSLSYDGFGRISAKVFTDTTVPPAPGDGGKTSKE